MVYIVMGVAGSGKTTVGRLLADRLRLPFHDADDAHAPESIAKMHRGGPLTDEDRKGWLACLSEAVAAWNREGGGVLACSALKEQYRRVLTKDGTEKVIFIHLHGAPELIRRRIEGRVGQYFPAAMLETQYVALEPPPDAISVDVSASPEAVCAEILQKLSERVGVESLRI